MTRTQGLQEFSIDPFDPGLLQDPFTVWSTLRRDAPVVWNATVGTFWVARYADVREGIFDDKEFSARTTAYQLGVTSDVDLGSFGRTNTLPTTDEPDHNRLRQIANKAFVPRAIAEYRSRIEELVDGYLDDAIGSGEVDIVTGLAETLPILVISELMGIPTDEAREFKRASINMMKAFTGPNMTPHEGQEATAAVRYLEDLFDSVRVQRQQEPKEDLLTRLAEAEAAGSKLSRPEYLATCLLILLGGNETTTNSISSLVYLFGSNPDQFAALRADPELVNSAVEEALRMLGPVQWAVRKARHDMTIAGTAIPKGSGVSFLLGSANRDGDKYPDPDRFDVTRNPTDHLAFGRGRHLCLGAPLARAELRAVAGALVRRCSSIDLRTTAPTWGGSLQSRGIERLLVTLPGA